MPRPLALSEAHPQTAYLDVLAAPYLTLRPVFPFSFAVQELSDALDQAEQHTVDE